MAIADARSARALIPRPNRLRSLPLKQLAVSVFFVANLIAIVSWSYPNKTPTKRWIDSFFAVYMEFTGLWQGWDMFAPDPLKDQIRVDALVTFADGRTAAWEFPQMHKMGLFERYQKERYRKWSQDNVRMNERRGLSSTTVKFVSRLFANPENAPVTIAFHRYWKTITPPDAAATASPDTWHRFMFYQATFAPEKR